MSSRSPASAAATSTASSAPVPNCRAAARDTAAAAAAVSPSPSPPPTDGASASSACWVNADAHRSAHDATAAPVDAASCTRSDGPRRGSLGRPASAAPVRGPVAASVAACSSSAPPVPSPSRAGCTPSPS
eukprot:353758-Chlamydomonas_euryale.AAC.3